MNARLLCTMLALVFGIAPAFSKTELQNLREENRALRAEISRLKAAAGRSDTMASSEDGAGADKTQARSGTYTVIAGDCLERIARKTRCTVPALAKANRLKVSAIIHPGQVLRIPGSAGASANPESMAKASKLKADSTQVAKTEPKAGPKSEPKATPVPKPSKPEPAPAAMAKNEPPKMESKAAASKAAGSNTLSETRTVSTSTPRPVPQPKAVAKSEPAAQTVAEQSAPEPYAPVRAKRSIIIQDQTTYGSFASLHNTTAEQLNELNGFTLSANTVLAKGSEIDVPAQP